MHHVYGAYGVAGLSDDGGGEGQPAGYSARRAGAGSSNGGRGGRARITRGEIHELSAADRTWFAVLVGEFPDLAVNGAHRTGRAGVLRVPDSRDPDHRRDCRSVGWMNVGGVMGVSGTGAGMAGT